VYGAWMSKEHFSVSRSHPVSCSASLPKLESAVRARITTYRPAPVIAKSTGPTWNLLYFVEKNRCRDVAPKQAAKYDGVRAGKMRWSSTMGQRPPSRETALKTVDLDAEG